MTDGLHADQRTVVHLVRHGEVHNPDAILYGRLPDYRLSEAGERMAEATAAWFAGRDVTLLVSSPLERAGQTAAPLAATLGLEVTLDDRLIEAENVFEGTRFDTASFRHWQTWRHLTNPFRPSWGEPYEQVAARVLAAAAAARDQAGGHEAACVSHQLPIWSARLKAEHRRLWHNPRHRQCALASVTSLVYRGDELVAVRYQEPAAGIPATQKSVGA